MSCFRSLNSNTESCEGPDHLRQGMWHLRLQRPLGCRERDRRMCRLGAVRLNPRFSLYFKLKTIVTELSLGPLTLGAGHVKPQVVQVKLR